MNPHTCTSLAIVGGSRLQVMSIPKPLGSKMWPNLKDTGRREETGHIKSNLFQQVLDQGALAGSVTHPCQ
ncbi:hypothetical protein scyTo_0006636 [Scyliorhinus torazame]|uniref:Uncharacterized protein n=1 Tax=Scyliorhinus torazame TaxID=75743 RepID=A0A401PJ40_SCYTO|nr:hypothetical protein [Scyliorhinus torazame]